MSEIPSISVNMITYNHANYIDKAIESIVNQKTEFLFELIIGEDFSTDNTREIIYNYKKKYPKIIKIITSDTNVGMFENFLRVERECQGKYIAYCEGDDYWIDPYKLQKQFYFLETHPECGLVHTDYNVLYDFSGFIDKNIHRNLKTDLFGSCFEKYWNMVGNHLAIKTVTVLSRANYKQKYMKILQDGISKGWKLGDFQRFALISRYSDIGYLPESTSVYRARSTGSATSHDGKNLNKSIEFTESILSAKRYLIDYLELDFDKFKSSLINDCKKIMLMSFRCRNKMKFIQYRDELLNLSQENIFEKLMNFIVKSDFSVFYRFTIMIINFYIKTIRFVEILYNPSYVIAKLNEKRR